MTVVVTSLILLSSFVHSLDPRYLSNRMLAVGDCFIPGYREISLPQIVITIWFFKDVTYICRASLCVTLYIRMYRSCKVYLVG